MHKILVVDDTEAIRTNIKSALEHNHFQVVSASNVTEALHYIATEAFDVLITDLHMRAPETVSRLSAPCVTRSHPH